MLAQVDLAQCQEGPMAALFAEELGLLLEVDPAHAQAVQDAYRCAPGHSAAQVQSGCREFVCMHSR